MATCHIGHIQLAPLMSRDSISCSEPSLNQNASKAFDRSRTPAQLGSHQPEDIVQQLIVFEEIEANRKRQGRFIPGHVRTRPLQSSTCSVDSIQYMRLELTSDRLA